MHVPREGEPVMIGEQWASVPGWEYRYSVSSIGRVVSLCSGRRREFFKKSHNMKTGYVAVTLCMHSHSDSQRVELWTVHRLMMCSFFPRKDSDRLDVAHLDGNRKNNILENLKWCTRKENESHKLAHGTRATGSKNGQSKLTESSAKAAKKMVISGRSQSSVARRFGVSPSAIWSLMSGRSWIAALNEVKS
jgi:hypothetical protein